jgi:hypothetical protein
MVSSITITDILNTETKRLTDKQTAIDNAEAERKRIIRLNASDVERQRAKNIIYIVFAAMLLVIVLIKLLYRFEILPDSILDLLIAITIAVGVIYCSILYSNILTRSDMDFSQIDLKEPAPKTAEQLQKENEDRIKTGDLTAIQSASQSGKCIGETCCPADTFFNTTYNLCVSTEVPITAVPTTVIDNNKNITDLKLNGVNVSLSGIKIDNNDANDNQLAEIIDNLTNSSKYFYCRKSDGTYAWMPITDSNKMVSGNIIIDVKPEDPNYFLDKERTEYNRETLSTKAMDAFTTKAMDAFTTKAMDAFTTKAMDAFTTKKAKHNSGIEPFSPSEVVDYHPYR